MAATINGMFVGQRIEALGLDSAMPVLVLVEAQGRNATFPFAFRRGCQAFDSISGKAHPMRLLLAILCAAALNLAAQPSATCNSGTAPLRIKMGGGIPLPRQYSNPTSQKVTFIVTMRANALFGPAQEVLRQTVPAKQGVLQSEAPVYPTHNYTPVGVARVILDVTTDRTGAAVVGRCDYLVTVTAPDPLPSRIASPTDALTSQGGQSWLLQVPVRMCMIEGSELAGGKKAGESVNSARALSLLEAVNRDIWYPEAQIGFSTALATQLPVIADPSPPASGRCGGTGDISVFGFGGGDTLAAVTLCEQAWAANAPGALGIPIVFARNFCDSGPILGVSAGPHPGLNVASRQAFSGKRGDALCGRPVKLTTADVVRGPSDFFRPFVALVEPKANSSQVQFQGVRNALAHELGHNLFLGHGNGLDDNNDGRSVGRPGPKRYDTFCDPAWLEAPDNTVLVEDKGRPFVNCRTSGSVMGESAGCSVLQPLQVETARGVAPFLPGAKNTTPPRPGLSLDQIR